MNDYQLKSEIMSRVKAVHMTRRFLRPVVFEATLFIAFLLVNSALISIRDVLMNMSNLSGPQAYANYIFLAFMRSQFIVQCAFVLTGVIFLLLLRSILRNFRSAASVQAA